MIIGQMFTSESGVCHFNVLAGMIPANIAINDISLKTRFFSLHFRCRKYWCIFNPFYVIRPESYRIRWNYAAFRAIMPFKVIEFGTNQKFICDFLLVINTNLAPISCTVSKLWLIIVENFDSNREWFTLTPSLWVISGEYPDKLYLSRN